MTPTILELLLEDAWGSFSFISHGVRLTYDYRKLYNNLILSRNWEPMLVILRTATPEERAQRIAAPFWIVR